MPRSVLPSEDCVFRLDHRYGFNQAYPMTFNNVGLSEDGFEFNDESSIIHVENPLPLGSENVATVELDITYDNIGGNGYGRIINDSRGINYFALYGRTDGTSLTIRTYDNIIYSVIGILTLGTRMKITIVFDNGTAYTYLNGELFDSNDTVGDIIDIPSFDIGNQLDLTRAFGGIIHSISIYNRALTPQEVADRYNEVTFNVE
jgi:hypothetical protein